MASATSTPPASAATIVTAPPAGDRAQDQVLVWALTSLDIALVGGLRAYFECVPGATAGTGRRTSTPAIDPRRAPCGRPLNVQVVGDHVVTNRAKKSR